MTAAPIDQLLETMRSLDERIAESNVGIAASNLRIAESNDRIAELTRFGQNNRRRIKLVALAVAFDVAISVIIGTVGFTALDASRKAQAANSRVAQAHAALVIQCNNTNASRADLRDLLTLAYDGPGATARTPAQQADADRFVALVKARFPPRDCTIIR